MNDEPLVSVWMTTYNHGPYIAKSIESVISQKTSFKFELVIGEDCSTDDTASICQEYAQRYPDIIKLFHRKKNLGMMENGYETFSKTMGAYIACLEGDDYWIDNNKLQAQVEALQQDKNAVICFTDVKFFDEPSQQYVENSAKKFISKHRYNFFDILNRNVISTGTVLFKNNFKSMLPPEIRLFSIGDWPIYLFLLADGSEAVYLNKITAVYRKHGGGVYSQTDVQFRVTINLGVYEVMLELPFFKKYKRYIEKEIAAKHLSVARLESIKEFPDPYIFKSSLRKSMEKLHPLNFFTIAKAFAAGVLFALRIKI